MSAVPADFRTTSPWRVALPAFVALAAAILLLYRDTAEVMVGIWWRSETFAHCLLVVPITLWLIWRLRDRLTVLVPRPQPWALLPLLLVAVVWLLSDLTVVSVVSQFALVAMLLLAVPAVLGVEVTAVILFPLLFLFFGVPFGEFVVPTMMELTADFTVSALQATGVPVFREGQHFVIPTGNWSVIDECSGVRYLMASFMVGTLFAYLNYRSYTRRAVFMLFSLLVPVLANWLRAYIIVMLAYLSGNTLAVGVDHLLYGWVFFGVIIFIMYAIGARWAEPDEVLVGSVSSDTDARRVTSSRFLAALLAGAVIVLLPHLTLAGLKRGEGAASDAMVILPERLAEGWSARDKPLSDWAPIFVNPSVESIRTYAGAAGAVGVHLAYYRGQRDDRKLISSTNVLVPMRGSEWNQMVGGRRDVTVGSQGISVNTAELIGQTQSGAERRQHLVVWRVYWIDGHFIASDVAAKITGGLVRLEGRGDEGAAIVMYADGETVAASNATLEAFVQANLSSLDLLLNRTRDAR